MLKFADKFVETGQYKGVELNRNRHKTRSKHQAKIDQFALRTAELEDVPMNAVLFRSFDFHITFLKRTLQERFQQITSEPISAFNIFDYRSWPKPTDETFNSYGDREVSLA